MSICAHCKGTGVAPDKITLECVGCQRPVSVTYSSSSELREKCENVRCADCKRVKV